MLRLIFRWLDATPAAYWALATLPTLLLLAWIARDVWQSSRANPRSDAGKISDGGFVLAIFVVLLSWRWIFLFNAHEFSPDESQQIAGALTLLRDPVFWRSVDGATAGPLDFYALWPTHALGVPMDYFNARLTGLLLVWGALTCTYFTLRREHDATRARLAVLPGVMFFALTVGGDFVYYTTEHVPLFLVAVAVWLLWRPRSAIATSPLRDPAWLAAGFVIGLSPWAKLQAAPLAGLLLLAGLALAWREPGLALRARLGRALALMIAAALPTVLGLGTVLATGQFSPFLHGYVLQNISYVDHGGELGATLREFAANALASPSVALLLAAAFIGGVWLLTRRSRPPGRDRQLVILGAALTLTAIFVAAVPRRAFPHYLLFVVVPLTLWVGAGFCEACTHLRSAKARRGLAIVAWTVGGMLPLLVRWTQPGPFMIGLFEEHWRFPQYPVSAAITALSRPGDALAVWGWDPAIYVETGLPQAVRDAHTFRIIEESRHQDYFFDRYLDDLRRARPPLFIDAVGPGAFHMSDRARHGHQAYPAMRDYIRDHYDLAQEVEYARIYTRKTAPPGPHM